MRGGALNFPAEHDVNLIKTLNYLVRSTDAFIRCQPSQKNTIAWLDASQRTCKTRGYILQISSSLVACTFRESPGGARLISRLFHVLEGPPRLSERLSLSLPLSNGLPGRILFMVSKRVTWLDDTRKKWLRYFADPQALGAIQWGGVEIFLLVAISWYRSCPSSTEMGRLPIDSAAPEALMRKLSLPCEFVFGAPGTTSLRSPSHL